MVRDCDTMGCDSVELLRAKTVEVKIHFCFLVAKHNYSIHNIHSIITFCMPYCILLVLLPATLFLSWTGPDMLDRP